MSWARLLLGPHLGGAGAAWSRHSTSRAGLGTLLASSFQDSGHTWPSLGPACPPWPHHQAQSLADSWPGSHKQGLLPSCPPPTSSGLGKLAETISTVCAGVCKYQRDRWRVTATNIRGHGLLQAGARVCSVKTDTDCILVRGSALATEASAGLMSRLALMEGFRCPHVAMSPSYMVRVSSLAPTVCK